MTFGGVERRGAWHDAVRSERGLRGIRNGSLRERMRQSFEGGVVLKREMRAFVRFDQDENARRGVGLREAKKQIPHPHPQTTRPLGFARDRLGSE
jgi:hypothetical protein